jgi:hypothetical protein
MSFKKAARALTIVVELGLPVVGAYGLLKMGELMNSNKPAAALGVGIVSGFPVARAIGRSVALREMQQRKCGPT